MSIYDKLEESAMFNVKVPKEKREPFVPHSSNPLVNSYFSKLTHPAFDSAANRAATFEAAWAATHRGIMTAMPADLLQMCRELDQLVCHSATAAAAAVRKMTRILRVWAKDHPSRQKHPHRREHSELEYQFAGEELSWDELFTGQGFQTESTKNVPLRWSDIIKTDEA